MELKKTVLNESIRIISVLITLPLITSANIDCNGKAFHCMNATHFMICVDLGGGVSSTIDNFVIPCPPSTVCQGTNHFECEFPRTTTAQAMIDTSVPSELISEITTVNSFTLTTVNAITSDVQSTDFDTVSLTTLQDSTITTVKPTADQNPSTTEYTSTGFTLTPNEITLSDFNTVTEASIISTKSEILSDIQSTANTFNTISITTLQEEHITASSSVTESNVVQDIKTSDGKVQYTTEAHDLRQNEIAPVTETGVITTSVNGNNNDMQSTDESTVNTVSITTSQENAMYDSPVTETFIVENTTDSINVEYAIATEINKSEITATTVANVTSSEVNLHTVSTATTSYEHPLINNTYTTEYTNKGDTFATEAYDITIAAETSIISTDNGSLVANDTFNGESIISSEPVTESVTTVTSSDFILNEVTAVGDIIVMSTSSGLVDDVQSRDVNKISITTLQPESITTILPVNEVITPENMATSLSDLGPSDAPIVEEAIFISSTDRHVQSLDVNTGIITTLPGETLTTIEAVTEYYTTENTATSWNDLKPTDVTTVDDSVVISTTASGIVNDGQSTEANAAAITTSQDKSVPTVEPVTESVTSENKITLPNDLRLSEVTTEGINNNIQTTEAITPTTATIQEATVTLNEAVAESTLVNDSAAVTIDYRTTEYTLATRSNDIGLGEVAAVTDTFITASNVINDIQSTGTITNITNTMDTLKSIPSDDNYYVTEPSSQMYLDTVAALTIGSATTVTTETNILDSVATDSALLPTTNKLIDTTVGTTTTANIISTESGISETITELNQSPGGKPNVSEIFANDGLQGPSVFVTEKPLLKQSDISTDSAINITTLDGKETIKVDKIISSGTIHNTSDNNIAKTTYDTTNTNTITLSMHETTIANNKNSNEGTEFTTSIAETTTLSIVPTDTVNTNGIVIDGLTTSSVITTESNLPDGIVELATKSQSVVIDDSNDSKITSSNILSATNVTGAVDTLDLEQIINSILTVPNEQEIVNNDLVKVEQNQTSNVNDRLILDIIANNYATEQLQSGVTTTITSTNAEGVYVPIQYTENNYHQYIISASEGIPIDAIASTSSSFIPSTSEITIVNAESILGTPGLVFENSTATKSYNVTEMPMTGEIKDDTQFSQTGEVTTDNIMIGISELNNNIQHNVNKSTLDLEIKTANLATERVSITLKDNYGTEFATNVKKNLTNVYNLNEKDKNIATAIKEVYTKRTITDTDNVKTDAQKIISNIDVQKSTANESDSSIQPILKSYVDNYKLHLVTDITTAETVKGDTNNYDKPLIPNERVADIKNSNIKASDKILPQKQAASGVNIHNESTNQQNNVPKELLPQIVNYDSSIIGQYEKSVTSSFSATKSTENFIVSTAEKLNKIEKVNAFSNLEEESLVENNVRISSAPLPTANEEKVLISTDIINKIINAPVTENVHTLETTSQFSNRTEVRIETNDKIIANAPDTSTDLKMKVTLTNRDLLIPSNIVNQQASQNGGESEIISSSQVPYKSTDDSLRLPKEPAQDRETIILNKTSVAFTDTKATVSKGSTTTNNPSVELTTSNAKDVTSSQSFEHDQKLTSLALNTEVKKTEEIRKLFAHVENKTTMSPLETKTAVTSNDGSSRQPLGSYNKVVENKDSKSIDTLEQDNSKVQNQSGNVGVHTTVKVTTTSSTESTIKHTPKNLNTDLTKSSDSVQKPTDSFCFTRNRGRYVDHEDCTKFYICIGKTEPIVGKCPANTVFSELKKQCTKNKAYCVRGNEFKCLSEGRFRDILKANAYYICVKRQSSFVRFKFQCQNGYYLNKVTVRCTKHLETVNQSSTSVDNSNSEKSVSEGLSSKETMKSKSSKENKKENKSGEEFECKKEGKFAAPDNCRNFYVCTKTKKSEFRMRRKKCDSDEVFHKDKKKCVDADSYEC